MTKILIIKKILNKCFLCFQNKTSEFLIQILWFQMSTHTGEKKEFWNWMCEKYRNFHYFYDYLEAKTLVLRNESIDSVVSTKRPFESSSNPPSSRQWGLRSVDRIKRSRHLGRNMKKIIGKSIRQDFLRFLKIWIDCRSYYICRESSSSTVCLWIVQKWHKILRV